jgi:hypothetical protein
VSAWARAEVRNQKSEVKASKMLSRLLVPPDKTVAANGKLMVKKSKKEVR